MKRLKRLRRHERTVWKLEDRQADSTYQNIIHTKEDYPMEYDFVFSPEERKSLTQTLNELSIPSATPYTAYQAYMDAILRLRGDARIPVRFASFCDEIMRRDLKCKPIVVIGNCPIDEILPVFDSEDPVRSKYELKKTFVAEGFLALYAVLTGTALVAHKSVNGGDFFHDIYPKKSMYETQSQKTLETLRFHRDFTNHFVTPDFVVTLTLRDTPENEVYSTFAINSDVIRTLPDDVKRVLEEEQFYTPYDDVSTFAMGKQLGRAKNHAIIQGDAEIKLFEGRTIGLTDAAKGALEVMLQALHTNKLTHIGQPGDCVSFANNYVIHGREVRQLRDIESLSRRWLMKTHNVYTLSALDKYFLPEQYGVVNG